MDGTPASVLACGHRGLQTVPDFGGTGARPLAKRVKESMVWRLKGGGRNAGQVNTVGAMKIIPAACLSPPACRAARSEFLSTCGGLVLAFYEHKTNCQPDDSFSSPGSGGRGSPKTGIGDRGKTNPSKSYCIARGVVCLAILARTNSEGA